MAPLDSPRQLRLAPDLGHGRTNGSGSRRKKDEDTNVTDRDVAALTWLGEQYGARADVLRVLLARLGVQGEGQLGERTLRQITDRHRPPGPGAEQRPGPDDPGWWPVDQRARAAPRPARHRVGVGVGEEPAAADQGLRRRRGTART
jgi:hypothetical protein